MLALKMWSLRLFVLLCFLGLAQQENAGKQLFRSKMINTIWAKAQNKMSSRKLDELHQLLETQDKAEMELKKERASGGDRDGAIEAKLRKTLRHILETYGLAGRVDVSDKERGMNRVQGRLPKDEQHTFGDRRLDSLWKAVQKQGTFSGKELQELEAEFGHHRDKMAEYESLQELFAEHDVSVAENTVMSQNEHNKQPEKLGEQLKKKQTEIHKDFQRLREKVLGDGQEFSGFEDERVNQLWEKAQDRGFSEEELQSIKEELSHFDHKIMKHKYYQEQADEAEKLLGNGQEHMKSKHDELKQRAMGHDKWVRKMHKTLLNKLSKTEL